jgi:hypothetical protein
LQEIWQIRLRYLIRYLFELTFLGGYLINEWKERFRALRSDYLIELLNKGRKRTKRGALKERDFQLKIDHDLIHGVWKASELTQLYDDIELLANARDDPLGTMNHKMDIILDCRMRRHGIFGQGMPELTDEPLIRVVEPTRRILDFNEVSSDSEDLFAPPKPAPKKATKRPLHRRPEMPKTFSRTYVGCPISDGTSDEADYAAAFMDSSKNSDDVLLSSPMIIQFDEVIVLDDEKDKPL